MIEHSVLSHRGTRSINEDALAVFQHETRMLFVLCDGLGGHGGGEIASALAVEAAEQGFRASGLTGEALLGHCVQLAQTALLQAQQKAGTPEELKTTIVLLLIENGVARWAHTGDSRLYFFRKHKMQLRTQDHSVPQMLVLQGEIRESQIRFHEDRNRLTRVLGMEEETPRFTVGEALAIPPQARFLLCSDGFWEWIDEREMSHCLKASHSPEAWLTQMETAVLQAGKGQSMDNYSAIAVFASP